MKTSRWSGICMGILAMGIGSGAAWADDASLGQAGAATKPAAKLKDIIEPGAVWKDDRGQQIQAHGGGILHMGDTYYWFGEDRTQGLDRNKRYVACYASKDLTNWEFRKQVVAWTIPDGIANGRGVAASAPATAPATATAPAQPGRRGPGAAAGGQFVLERPKVFYNEKTKKFVMYMHLDSANYGLAHVGIAVSDTVDGEYKYVKDFRPLNEQSRDIGQFVDDDGTAYLVFEDRPNGFHISKLSDDYMTVEKDMILIPKHMEGGALVHYDGLYYAIGSNLTGWNANPNTYATAKKLEGPWSDFKDIAPRNTNTYGSQSTLLLKVVGSKTTTVIFMGDQWKSNALWDSRYLWMPVQIGNGQLTLPEPKPWSIDIKTGEVTIKK